MQRRTGNNPIVVHCRYVNHDPVMMTIDDSSNALFIKLSRRALASSYRYLASNPAHLWDLELEITLLQLFLQQSLMLDNCSVWMRPSLRLPVL